MFWALAFVAVGEEEGDTADVLPFGFAGGDELVEDGLGAVSEVAELGFPDAEHLGVVDGVAVVEAEDGGFGEAGVMDAEAVLFFRDVVEGGVAFEGFCVVEDGVAVAEGASFAVLA